MIVGFAMIFLFIMLFWFEIGYVSRETIIKTIDFGLLITIKTNMCEKLCGL